MNMQKMGIVMVAYVVFVVDEEFDAEKMQTYRATGRDSLVGRNARFLSLKSCKMEALEGEAIETLVILEFPSYDEAKDWYYSDAYQSHSELRKNATRGRAFLVDGIDVAV